MSLATLVSTYFVRAPSSRGIASQVNIFFPSQCAQNRQGSPQKGEPSTSGAEAS